MRTILLTIILFTNAVVWAGTSDRPIGQNCNLSAPPDIAGEETNHGATLKIHPRAKDIDSSYTGCQALWAPDKEKWALISLVAVESGDPIRVWSPHVTDPKFTECLYNKGKVVKGDAMVCPDPEFLIQKSLAPGCVEKIRSSVANNGIGVPLPPGCEYE